MSSLSFGYSIRNSGMTTDYNVLLNAAKLCEKLGYDVIWVSERLLPTDNWEEFFANSIYDPLIALSTFALITKKIKLGTSVLNPFRHPLITGRMLTTLDHVSKGRLIVGLGVGWRKIEVDSMGINFKDRGKVLDEQLDILKLLWTSKKISFKGQFYDLNNINSNERPIQRPYPQIWIGGNSIKAINRACEKGSGWIPSSIKLKEYIKSIDYIDSNMSSRPNLGLDVNVLFNYESKHKAYFSNYNNMTDVEERCAIGSPSDVINYLSEFIDIGVKYFVFRPFPGEDIDTMKTIAKEILPKLK